MLDEMFVAAIKTFHCAGSVIFQHDVGRRDQAVHCRLALGVFQIDGQAAFVAVERGEEARAETAETAGVIAVWGGLDLDDIGAEFGKQQARGRTHDGVGEFENFQSRQGPSRHQAAIRRNASRLPAWISSPGS